MENKKESSFINIFVYLLIVILIVLIIFPPLSRVFFKENDVTDNSSNNSNTLSNATALTCRREVMVGTMVYNVTITSNYGNDILNKVTFNYELPEVIDQTVVDNPIDTEINTIRNSGLVEENATETSVSFVLTKETKEANPTNTSLDNYFQPLDTQQTNLESLGYTCSTLTA